MDPRIEKLLKLPKKQKIALLVAILLFEGAALYWGLFLPRQTELKELRGRLEGLQNEVREKERIANNLPKLKREYQQLQKDLDLALTELPNQKEIPSLLTGITSVGKSAGNDFLLFRPKPEVSKDFYAEVPVDISISGTFHSVANFFTAVGKLPRIVNITDVSFADIKQAGGKTSVKVNCLATTFRFLDKKETKDDKKK
ncbi:Pilus assembly protein PilO [Geobacter metallireducens RCH3]|uniref:Type IV pilus biogenesis protein PilO n=1 Tax=Geobacter metallireducens (strain ATCC 53774 / DSM 7210 / GS-15) TaxID=269799 RepID=Q39X09_GEOMG|nr:MULTISPECIES: type 4a pilus biogenesis protein PilO [Geobacter]ABB31215.1 type IV pilus biogenesis protein PilO [Geobacter metallireducens GS-15]EHP84613.1 Pilus assembly protein PilO [Geobacter metallireducens RCH3]MBT1076592.1 type 4a pilus biogenesis protein PilO [Geobacter grbiciae]